MARRPPIMRPGDLSDSSESEAPVPTKEEDISKLLDNLTLGAPSPSPDAMILCAWRAVHEYADHYVGVTVRPKIQEHFKFTELLSARVWNFFYFRDPDRPKNPCFLVPRKQVAEYLGNIGKKHGLQLYLPPENTRNPFSYKFPEHIAPPPRYLGRINSEDDWNYLTCTLPDLDEWDAERFRESNACQRLFESMVQAGFCTMTLPKSATGNRKKGPAKRRGWGAEMRRVQRYLGLRSANAGLSESQRLENYVREIDLAKPLPFKPEKNVVFVSIDVEWMEECLEAITEVGIALLYNKDIDSVPPGENAVNWMPFVKSRHFRVRNYMHHVNSKYIMGCPDKFRFGKSEVLYVDAISDELTRMFAEWAASGTKAVVVAHGVGGDLKALDRIGFRLLDTEALYELIDTGCMFGYLRQNDNQPSVRSGLDHFLIPSFNLHNAGNDAVYTLQLLFATAIKKRLIGLDFAHGRSLNPGIVGEGWSTEEERNDGGTPTKLSHPLR